MVGGVALLVIGLALLLYPTPLAAVLGRWQHGVRAPFLTSEGRVRTARGVGLIAAVVGLLAILLTG